MAGASIYLVCKSHSKFMNDHSILEKISEKVQIAEGTILNAFNTAYKEREKLLPEYLLRNVPNLTAGRQ